MPLALSLIVALAGCAGQEAAPPAGPLRFAAFVGPRVGHADAGGATAEDALLEVVTALSAEPGLDLAFVAGPLVGDEEAAARDGLLGALGSIAAPLYVAVAEDDAPRAELLEALERGLPKRPGTLEHVGALTKGWLPVALAPGGELPAAASPGDEEEGPARLGTIAVRAGEGGPPTGVTILVVAGDTPALSEEGGVVVLTLPPLWRPPHVYALGTVSPEGEVSVSLRTAFGEPPPASPAPVRARVR